MAPMKLARSEYSNSDPGLPSLPSESLEAPRCHATELKTAALCGLTKRVVL